MPATVRASPAPIVRLTGLTRHGCAWTLAEGFEAMARDD
jgi:hypothetical protein